MSAELKRQVLHTFKVLHRTRLNVFKGDDKALAAARERINYEFRKNKTLCDDSAIRDMVVYAQEVDEELKTTVVQAQETDPGVFALRITPDTTKLDNMPFNPDIDIPEQPCCKQMTPCCRQMRPCQQVAASSTQVK
ncbi:complex III assembly factor LYRM7 [Cimex lectularius]|uniref:Complex III assembly factor LYRM7 n=1 Tax=Cimex lectularius TaxID=79782 RepID=A0A8I6RZ23_CIMLE|nr:complex III assembly factor LYRM7 [Cimex lectularius]